MKKFICTFCGKYWCAGEESADRIQYCPFCMAAVPRENIFVAGRCRYGEADSSGWQEDRKSVV